MTDPDCNLQSCYSNFLTAYDAVMSGVKSLSNRHTPKNAIAFGQKVEQTAPINSTSIPDGDRPHNRFNDSRIKQMSITTLDSKEICLDRSFELSVRPETFQKADSDTESELKIVRVWSMAEEDGSQSVNNSHQHSNVMEQISPIIHADNLSNKSVSNPPEKITDNKASRLERRRERRKDPAFAERERERKREYQRKRRKDPTLAEREREYQRKYQRKRRKDPTLAERERKLDRERKRERRKDPVFVEGHRIYMNTYNRIKRQTANKEEASKQAKIAKEQYLQTIHSAGNSRELILISNSVETNQSSSKNSDGTPPAIFQSSS